MNRVIRYSIGLVAFAWIVFSPGAALKGDLPPAPVLTPDGQISAPAAMGPFMPQAVQPASPTPSAEATPPSPEPEAPAPAKMTAKQLDELVASIALYPDVLLAQVLTASTYPLDVVESDRWLKANPNATQDEIDRQNWDPSVKAVARFPKVIATMSEKLGWTRELGKAVLNQEQEVMEAVQRDRQVARQNGALQSTPEQTVEKQDGNLVIAPANPQVIYVPQYYPQYVYGYDNYSDNYPYYAYNYDPYSYRRDPYRYRHYSGLWYDWPVYCGGWLDIDFDWGRRCLYYGGWGYRHHRHDWDNRHRHRHDWDRRDGRRRGGHDRDHDSFDKYSSGREWRHGSDYRSGDGSRYAYDSSGINRVGMTNDRFNRRIDPARISQRLRQPTFSYGGDARVRNRGLTDARLAGRIETRHQAGIRNSGRITRDDIGQIRDRGRAAQVVRSPLGGSSRRGSDMNFRSGNSMRRGELFGSRSGSLSSRGGVISPRGLFHRGGGVIARSSAANTGRSYRIAGLAGGNYNGGRVAIRSGGSGGNRGGAVIRGGGGGSFRGSSAGIRGGGGSFRSSSAGIRGGGGGPRGGGGRSR